jgi:hypothetical protein
MSKENEKEDYCFDCQQKIIEDLKVPILVEWEGETSKIGNRCIECENKLKRSEK